MEVVLKVKISSRKAHKEETLRSQSLEIMNNILGELCEKLCDLSVNPEKGAMIVLKKRMVTIQQKTQ